MSTRPWVGIAEHASKIGLWERDFATGRLICSPGLLDLLGYESEASPTLEAILALVHPDDRPAMGAMVPMPKAGGPFAYSFRIVLPSGEVRWIEARGVVEVDEKGRPVREIGANVDVTEHKRAEVQAQLLLRELHHRVKNSFALVGALIDISAQEGETDVDSFVSQLRARVASLSTAHQMSFVGEALTSVSLAELTERLLEPWCGLDRHRVRVGGDRSLVIAAEHVTVVALVIHELATNAVKYGALGQRHGRLSIEIAAASEPGLARLLWLETQPDHDKAARPVKPGFGTLMIDRSLARIGGSIGRSIEPGYFEVSAILPIVASQTTTAATEHCTPVA